MGKWGIERIHFLIPVLVGILILSVATVPSAFAEGRQGLLAYDGKKIAIYELSIYESGFKEVWSDDDWGEGWTQFLQFYRCEEREDYILGSDTETYFWWNCSGYPEDPGFADPHLLAYNPTTGAVQISKIKDGGARPVVPVPSMET